MEEPAATYSPRPVKAKYHRRCGAYLLCSEWEEVFPPRQSHRRLFETAPRGPSKLHNPPTRVSKNIRQALDPLVPVSYTHCCVSRSGLSTWWSTRGLTPSRGWENSSRGRLPA